MNDTGIEGYRIFLERRDGEADLLNRRLERREEFFSDLEADPVRSAHPADRRSSREICVAACPSRAWTERCSSSWPPPN